MSAQASVVVDLDHVTTVLDPEPARELFAALERLELPLAWGYAEYRPFATGGVVLGNVILEVIGVESGGPSDWPPQFVTFAPPGIEGLVDELDRRGVPHGNPEPFRPGPDRDPLFTTVSLPELGGPGLGVQLCAYAQVPHRPAEPSTNHAGIVDVERVVLGTRDVDTERTRWAALLAPIEPGSDGVWRPRRGPTLELRRAREETVIELALRVRSVPAAGAVIADAGIEVDGERVGIGTLPARLITAA